MLLAVAISRRLADLLDELFSIANTAKSDAFMLQAHHAAWPNFMMMGSFSEARHHITRGLALYRRDAHGDQAFQYGSHDPGVCAYVCDALIGTVIGFPDQGVAQIREALALANDLNHGETLVQALAWAADLYQLRREPREGAALRPPASATAGNARFTCRDGKCHDAPWLGTSHAGGYRKRHRNNGRRSECVARDWLSVSFDLPSCASRRSPFGGGRNGSRTGASSWNDGPECRHVACARNTPNKRGALS